MAAASSTLEFHRQRRLLAQLVDLRGIQRAPSIQSRVCPRSNSLRRRSASTVSPTGSTLTEGIRGSRHAAGRTIDALVATIPFGRPGMPEDIARRGAVPSL